MATEFDSGFVTSAVEYDPVVRLAELYPVALLADLSPVALLADLTPVALLAELYPVALLTELYPVALLADLYPVACSVFEGSHLHFMYSKAAVIIPGISIDALIVIDDDATLESPSCRLRFPD